MTLDFVKNSKQIARVLNIRTKDMTEDERIRYVYNEAIDDAVNWVVDIGKSNPELRLACMRLKESMRKWLPLREENLK